MLHSALFGGCQDLQREALQKSKFSVCHVSTEAATDDPSKSAKRAKRGNAGSVHSSKTAEQCHYIFRAPLFYLSQGVDSAL